MATQPRIGQARRPTVAPRIRGARASAGVAADPFAQTSPAAIDAYIKRVVSQLPPTMTPGQIGQQVNAYRASLPKPLSAPQMQSQAQASLDPVVQRLTANINAQAARQGQALRGYTETLANQLAGMIPQASAPYQQAEAATAASSQSLADRLAGGGQAAGQDLQSRLASINAPGAVDPAVQAAQQSGAGAGNSLYASGNAALAEFAANAAAAGGYAAKLPAIARLAGVQQAGLVGQTAATNLANQVGQVEQQLPTLVQNLRSMSEQRASERAQAAQQFLQQLTGASNTAATNRASTTADLLSTLLGQNITKATAKAGLIGDQVKATAPQFLGSGSTGYYAVDPMTGQSTQVVPAAPKAAKAAPRPIIVGSDKTGRYSVDPVTGQKTLITPAVAGTKKTKAGGVSATSYANLKKQALRAVDLYYYGKQPDRFGQGGIPGIDYEQALGELMHGYSLSRKDAETIANDFYAPGERGRPQTAQSRQAQLLNPSSVASGMLKLPG